MEQVVLLSEDGEAVGVHDKATVHHQNTPLHLAFSSYIVNRYGEVLITQRATTKPTWPGVWTNSCCGHPAPDEPLEAAVLRRIRQELGIHSASARLVLPRFRYRAVMENGVVENEMCPVYAVMCLNLTSLNPDPDEVSDISWEYWPTFSKAVLTGDELVSPWCYDQVAQLRDFGTDPRSWPRAAANRLPRAAQATIAPTRRRSDDNG